MMLDCTPQILVKILLFFLFVATLVSSRVIFIPENWLVSLTILQTHGHL